MARQVIFRQRDEGPADILAGGLRGFAQGRLLRQQQSGNRLTEDLTRRKLAEALRLSGVASEFESGDKPLKDLFLILSNKDWLKLRQIHRSILVVLNSF